MDATNVPTPGQLVTVRQRRFVVASVEQGAVPPDSISVRAPQHLVSLQSVEDDGLGEELQVIWEIEPGTAVFERATLPDPTKGFDEPARLEAFLDAVRWGAVASADVQTLHAPFRSGITIEDYQLDPVARAVQMPRVNLLVADDVGLGKTIESGLVVQELILRNRARSILVVCPAGLQVQWREQMRDKFGLEFRIVDSAAMRELRRQRGLHVNPWTHFPRLITSVDFLKRERPMRLFRDALPPEGKPSFPRRFDLLIVDEAHNVAPPGRTHYAVDSLRTTAIQAIAKHFEHKLFLTATPHNGYTESFSALLELLDDQRFHRGVPPDRKQLGAVMVRRLKRELPPDDLGRPRFPKRELEALEVRYTAEERRAFTALVEYTRLRLEGATEAEERFASEFVLKLLKKRLFSSPEAFRSTLAKHETSLREARKRGKADVRRPSVKLLEREVAAAEEDAADDGEAEERREEAVEATSSLFRPLSKEEAGLLDELHRWAETAAGRPDSKARRLLDWLTETVRTKGKWNDTRVILFTEYRSTQNWLLDRLAEAGLTKGERVLTLYGGMPTDERERIKAAFQASPDVSEVRILLATDAASEGIDLQNHCSRLVHYEIPWNPNRLEQRNGRIDRHGQRAPVVQVFHFVGEGWQKASKVSHAKPGSLDADLEFLMRAAEKVEQIREDLGSVGDVIASDVEKAMLGQRHSNLAVDPNAGRSGQAKAVLAFERKLREELARLRDSLKASRTELHLSPETLRAVVAVGLELAGQPPLEAVEVAGARPGTTATAWHLPALQGSWAACSEGLPHPHTQDIRPIVFDDELAAGRDDVVLAHLNHRLVQMCMRLLRAEVWAPDQVRKLHRVSARVVPTSALAHPVLVAYGRLVVLGADGARLHEEILSVGGELREGKFVRVKDEDLAAALEAADDAGWIDAPEATKERLAALWPKHAPAVEQALDAKKREPMARLNKALARRAESEASGIKAILEELRRTIRDELAKEPPPQLALWPTPERDQLERNRASLQARADAIPTEIDRETARIRERYAGPTPRLFPIALTFLVPQSLARRS